MTVILSGWPMVRLASSRRSPRLSRAARRRKMRLSQYSTCEKNSRCWQPACSRSREVKKGVRWVSHFGRPNAAFTEYSFDVKRIHRDKQDDRERSRQQHADGAQQKPENQGREERENWRQFDCLCLDERRDEI